MAKHDRLPPSQAMEYACRASNVLSGFEVEAGHSVLLCEQGFEFGRTGNAVVWTFGDTSASEQVVHTSARPAKQEARHTVRQSNTLLTEMFEELLREDPIGARVLLLKAEADQLKRQLDDSEWYDPIGDDPNDDPMFHEDLMKHDLEEMFK